MGRFSAASQVAAFFLIAICSPLAQACETCDRAPAAPIKPTSRNLARLDVTAAVDTATSFVIKAWRSLNPSYDVLIVEGDAPEAPLTEAEYAAAAYADSDAPRKLELPGFRHRYSWELTYRDEGLESAQPSGPAPGTEVTLDDSRVLGLRFELAYGWKR